MSAAECAAPAASATTGRAQRPGTRVGALRAVEEEAAAEELDDDDDDDDDDDGGVAVIVPEAQLPSPVGAPRKHLRRRRHAQRVPGPADHLDHVRPVQRLEAARLRPVALRALALARLPLVVAAPGDDVPRGDGHGVLGSVRFFVFL